MDPNAGAVDTELPPDEVADRLRLLMAERGWSRNQLAEAAGVEWMTIKRLLGETPNPRQVYPLTLARMAVALGQPWDWLGAAPPTATPPGPGRRLAASRLAAGLSTQELAALTGLPTRTVNQLERGLQVSAHRRTWANDNVPVTNRNATH